MTSPHNQRRWSTRNIQKLLVRMEEYLPSNDSRAFQKTQSGLDWGKIAFEDFTGKMCRLKWLEVSHNLRKYRTLTELVLEAKEQVKSPQESKEYKKHPDFPKMPLTAYLRFYKEQRAQYCQLHPELNNTQLTKVLSEKYRQLPEQVRQRYVQEFQKEKRDYKDKVAQFKKDHPDLVQSSKQSVGSPKLQTNVPKQLQEKMKTERTPPEMDELPHAVKFLGEPKKPPMNGFHKFQQDLWSSEELCHLPTRKRMVEIGRRWHRVPPSMKELYKSQAQEMEKQYWVDLDTWLRTLSPEEYAAYRKAEATCGKRKCMISTEGPVPKFVRKDLQPPSSGALLELPREQQETDSSETPGVQHCDSQGSRENVVEDGKEDEGSSSSHTSSGDEDEEEDGSSEDSGLNHLPRGTSQAQTPCETGMSSIVSSNPSQEKTQAIPVQGRLPSSLSI